MARVSRYLFGRHRTEVAEQIEDQQSVGGGGVDPAVVTALDQQVTTLDQRVTALEAAGPGGPAAPPRSSTGGLVSGVTITYGFVGGRTVAVLNKRGSGTAGQVFGWPQATRGDFVDQIAADGADNAAWLADAGTHDIWEVGFPNPGGQWSVLTHAQFETDLAAAGLPAWGDPTKVPVWMP